MIEKGHESVEITRDERERIDRLFGNSLRFFDVAAWNPMTDTLLFRLDRVRDLAKECNCSFWDIYQIAAVHELFGHRICASEFGTLRYAFEETLELCQLLNSYGLLRSKYDPPTLKRILRYAYDVPIQMNIDASQILLEPLAVLDVEDWEWFKHNPQLCSITSLLKERALITATDMSVYSELSTLESICHGVARFIVHQTLDFNYHDVLTGVFRREKLALIDLRSIVLMHFYNLSDSFRKMVGDKRLKLKDAEKFLDDLPRVAGIRYEKKHMKKKKSRLWARYRFLHSVNCPLFRGIQTMPKASTRKLTKHFEVCPNCIASDGGCSGTALFLQDEATLSFRLGHRLETSEERIAACHILHFIDLAEQVLRGQKPKWFLNHLCQHCRYEENCKLEKQIWVDKAEKIVYYLNR